ncbi:MAG: fused MFS/spermidine synthase [Candidatus Krumholzibacteriota bacterium]|nr:fused MFS/spermidine synthase [Candidatus Krumholzibacteriota bacterium]
MRRATPFILILFTLSGVSGLVYEIVWIRLFTHLLGGTTYAISIVLAAFMGGLALGSRHFGRRADASARPLRLYAGLELGIAVLGALVPWLLHLARPLYVGLAHALPAPTLPAVRILIAAVLLLPPTFLMGGTLPVLSRFVVRERERLGRGLGLLYAVNTMGAVAGSFLAGFVLVAAMGVYGTIALAVWINAVIALAVWLVDRGLPAAPLPGLADAAGPEAAADAATAAEAAKAPRRGAAQEAPAAARGAAVAAAESPDMDGRLLAWIFALSGFAAMGYELYWTRALQHFLGNSTYAFSAMLTTFLLGLAVGGWVGGRLADRLARPARLLGWAQLAAGAAALATVPLIWDLLPRLEAGAFLGERMSWASYLGRRFLVSLAIMAPATFLTGMTFPLVNRIGIASLARLGRGVGHLYFANTLGAIAGSLAAGYLLLPLLGVRLALLATACLSGLLGVAVHLGSRGRGAREPWLAAVGLVALLLLAPAARRAGGGLMADTQGRADRVLFQREDRAAETRVYRKPTGELHMSVDGHHIGGTDPSILRKEKILAHLPLALAPDARRTLSVGLGSGITLGTLALYDGIEELACVEIVPGVVAGARRFHEHHGAVLVDPRAKITIGDGVQYLLTTDRRFDIISSDSKLNPEYAGNAPLLSRDYYELCRSRLAEGGVMVQWLSIHLPASELRVVARSFAAAFPHVAVFWYDPNNVILAGSDAPLAVDIDRLREHAADPELRADLEALQLADPYALAGLYLADRARLLAELGDGPLNTWARPRLEFTLSREFRRKARAYHEADNLTWLARLQDFSSLALKGDVDPDAWQRYAESSRAMLAGYAAGGGADELEPGRAEFEKGLDANPDDARIARVLDVMSAVEERLSRAEETGRLDTPEAMVRLGIQRHEAGRNEEALRLFERALAERPGDADIQYNRLLVLRALNRAADLDAGVRAFVADFPRDARGHSLEGRQWVERSQQARDDATRDEMLRRGLAAFERSVEQDPTSAVFRNNVASALASLRRFAEAGDAFAAVCAMDPDFPHAAFSAAASYSMAGRTEESAHWVRVCVERRLAEPQAFRTHPFFANLRASERWTPALLQAPR